MLTSPLQKGSSILAAAAAALVAVGLSGCTPPDAAPSGSGGQPGGGTGGETRGGTGGKRGTPDAGDTPDGGIPGTDYVFADGGLQSRPARPRSTAGGESSPGGATGDSSGAPPAAPVAAATGGGGMPSSGGVIGRPACGMPPCPPLTIPAGQLTAGEWNDLAHWDFFLNMLAQPAGSTTQLWGAAQTGWGLFPTTRLPISVTQAGKPALNVPVELRDAQGSVLWRAVTDKQGAAQLFTGMFAPATGPFSVHAGAGATTRDVAVHEIPSPLTAVSVELPGQETPAPAPALDLMLMVDTTGSMGDELKYIQSELQNVVSRVKSQLANLARLRLSVNFYRDLGDEYVVRAYPFTADDDAAVQAIAQQFAGGGGDAPEAVDHALQVAVNEHDWDAQANARVLLLVLDAPPHGDQGTLARVRDALADTAAKGIQIIPVGASGIDKNTELLLRFMAIATSGSYAFLTNDSGIGNPHLDPSPTIGPFNVEFLNDLLVRVITDRL